MAHDCEYEYHLTWDTGEPNPTFACAERAYEKWMGLWLCPPHLQKRMEHRGEIDGCSTVQSKGVKV